MILCAVNGRSKVMSKYSVYFCGPTFPLSSLQKLPLVTEPWISSGPIVTAWVASAPSWLPRSLISRSADLVLGNAKLAIAACAVAEN